MASLEGIGGIEDLILPGQKVLLKPNMLSAKGPERAITTHPSVIEAAAKMVRDLGATPFIGDSPGGALRGITRVWENTGIGEMAEKAGIELVNFEASGSEEIRSGDYVFHIAKPVLEADRIINLCKLKTHVLTLMTCAVKNLFGAIPGFRKAQLHKEFPKPREFARMLVELYGIIRPSITIVDAVLAMQGDGPSSGDPIKLGLIMAGRDAVAVDTVASEIIGFSPGSIDTTRIAGELSLGVSDPQSIRIVGNGADIRPESFDLPSNRRLKLVPRPIARMISPLVWLKPYIREDLCVGCRICEKSCPVKTISFGEGVCEIDDSKCINCLCCHELCPENAVKIKMSWLARIIS